MSDTATTTSAVQADEQAIRELIEGWARAAAGGDLEKVMQCYTDDILAFDAIGPLQLVGRKAYGEHWKTCLSFMPEGNQMTLEVHHLSVEQEGRIAFAHYLSRCGCTDESGKEQLGWMRATVCCRKTTSGWKIAHEHYSSPFDPHTMKVPQGLAP